MAPTIAYSLSLMKALVFDGRLRLDRNYPQPVLKPGWAVIRVTQAGICGTDLELIRGYMNFRGVPGHEFVGTVYDCADNEWIGRRVVGEINAACGDCAMCRKGLGRHCPNRSVLGILDLDGCFAEFCALPVPNLHRVPDAISDSRAIFTEPVSAAFQILEQISLTGAERCVVLGDGKIGILCAWALATAATDITLVGHHPGKLAAAAWRSIRTTTSVSEVEPGADLVIEATGSAGGLADAMALCRPRGTLVLKSTIAAHDPLDLAPIVVKELQVVGSRCGLFKNGLNALLTYDFPLEGLIKGRYPLDEAEAAFAHAARPEALKILIDME
jgi:alcohol dehydrogenase